MACTSGEIKRLRRKNNVGSVAPDVINARHEPTYGLASLATSKACEISALHKAKAKWHDDQLPVAATSTE